MVELLTLTDTPLTPTMLEVAGADKLIVPFEKPTVNAPFAENDTLLALIAAVVFCVVLVPSAYRLNDWFTFAVSVEPLKPNDTPFELLNTNEARFADEPAAEKLGAPAALAVMVPLLFKPNDTPLLLAKVMPFK